MSSLRSPLPPIGCETIRYPIGNAINAVFAWVQATPEGVGCQWERGAGLSLLPTGGAKGCEIASGCFGPVGEFLWQRAGKKCAACDAESISSKSESQPRKRGREKEEERQAASPERFLKITKLLSICSRGRNSNNNNNGMSLTTINHGRLSGRVAAWVCLVGVHRRRLCACLARLIVLCLRLQRCFIFALNFASLTC